MEHAELCRRPRIQDTAQHVDTARGGAVTVQVLVSPDFRPLVQPRGGAVGVVSVREQNGDDPDLQGLMLLI